jgi:hypothetical protein
MMDNRAQCLQLAAGFVLGGDDYVASIYGVTARTWIGVLRKFVENTGRAPFVLVDRNGPGPAGKAVEFRGTIEELREAAEDCEDAPPKTEFTTDLGTCCITASGRRGILSATSPATSDVMWTTIRNALFRLELGCNTDHAPDGSFVYLPNAFRRDCGAWVYGFALRAQDGKEVTKQMMMSPTPGSVAVSASLGREEEKERDGEESVGRTRDTDIVVEDPESGLWYVEHASSSLAVVEMNKELRKWEPIRYPFSGSQKREAKPTVVATKKTKASTPKAPVSKKRVKVVE